MVSCDVCGIEIENVLDSWFSLAEMKRYCNDCHEKDKKNKLEDKENAVDQEEDGVGTTSWQYNIETIQGDKPEV